MKLDKSAHSFRMPRAAEKLHPVALLIPDYKIIHRLPDQLGLSPQCGFSSTVEGNTLTREQQFAKLRLIIGTAEEVWG
jgi:hypothetical protein